VAERDATAAARRVGGAVGGLRSERKMKEKRATRPAAVVEVDKRKGHGSEKR